MRVLVTNDDGLHAPGIAHLANAAVAAGHDVVAVAPEENMSGSAAAIGDLGDQSSIRCRRMELDRVPGVEAYALDGAPALCVIVSLLEAFGDRPDIEDPCVPEPMLRVTTRTETTLTRVPYRNVGFRCVRRLR